jgi:hypothetical protein
MKLLLSIIIILSPSVNFASVDYIRYNFELANSSVIALVEIINLSDSTLILKVIDPIKGCRINNEIEVKKPKSNSVPYGNWKTATVGQKDVLFLDSIGGFHMRDGHPEYDLLFKNDSVFIQSLAFQHGCFFKKYKDDRSIVYGSKIAQYSYQDFKRGILDYITSQDRLYKLISKEKSIILMKKKEGNSFSPREGEIPIIQNRYLVRFISKSEFHARLIDEIIDREITRTL